MMRFIRQFGKGKRLELLADHEFTCALWVLGKRGSLGLNPRTLTSTSASKKMPKYPTAVANLYKPGNCSCFSKQARHSPWPQPKPKP